jgi:FeS assembly SUF system regulator
LIRLTSLADYAVVIMSAAARHVPQTRLTAALIAGETGVPLPTAAKLLGLLARAGLLESLRGQAGGFRLARGAEGISLAEIIEAVDGPIAMTSCVEHGRNDCGLDGTCRVRAHWPLVNGAVRGALAAVSLGALAGDVA